MSDQFSNPADVRPGPYGLHAVIECVDCVIVDANPAAAKLLGATAPAALINRRALDFVHPHQRAMLREYGQRLAQHPDIIVVEAQIVCDIDRLHWVELIITPHADRLHIVLYDVSDRKTTEQTLRQQNEYLALLHDTALDVMNRLDLDDALQAIVGRAGALVGTDHAYMYLFDAQQNDLVLTLGTGVFTDRVGTRLRLDEGVAGHVWQHQQPLVVPDYGAWEGRSAHFLPPYGYAVTGVPLIANGMVIGVLGLTFTDPQRIFTPEEVHWLVQLADLAAIALENARLYTQAQQELKRRIDAEVALRESETRYRSLFDAAQRQAQRLTLLDTVRSVLSRELNPHVVFRKVVEAVADTFGYSQVSLYVVYNDVLEMQHQVGYDQVLRRIPLSQGVMGRVVRTHQPLLLRNVYDDSDFLGAIEGITSELCVPLFDADAVVGVLNVETTGDIQLDDADLHLMIALSEHISIAIERARLYTEAKRRSSMLESISDTFLAFDYQWHLTYANEQAERLLHLAGCTTDQLRHTPPQLCKLLHELGLAQHFEVVAHTHTAVNAEAWSSSLGLWFTVRVYPLSDGFAVYVQDISERKHLEQERLVLDRKMLEAQKLESLGLLAGGIAHDFNNLLMTILGNAQLALLDLPADSPAYESLEQIERTTTQAADLTRQMLIYAGRAPFTAELLNINTIIQEMQQLLHTSLARTVHVQYNLSPTLPLIEHNVAQLRQIIMNLTINAAEAIDQDEGVVTISTGAWYADRAYLASTLVPNLAAGQYVYFEVTDTGSGMDEATIAKIFDPFFTTKFTGRGLGLAAVWGIIRSHHGTMRVASVSGYGSTFRVLFPAVEDTATNAALPD